LAVVPELHAPVQESGAARGARRGGRYGLGKDARSISR
jgi:hypothetical protein